MERNLLIIGTGVHRESAYNTFLKEGYSLIMVDKAGVQNLALADISYTVADLRNYGYVFELAKEVYKKHNCSGIITFDFSCVILVGKLSDYFNLCYYSENTARNLTNKIAVRKYMKKNGLNKVSWCPIHTFAELKEMAGIFKFPCVLKPSDQSGSRGITVINEHNDLNKAFISAMQYSINKQLILEEYLAGSEYCVLVFFWQQKPFIISITEKQNSKQNNWTVQTYVTPAPLKEGLYNLITVYTETAVSIFDYCNGFISVDLKVGFNQEPRILEINPFPPSGNILESIWFLRGINLYKVLAEIAVKEFRDYLMFSNNFAKKYDTFMLYSFLMNNCRTGIIKKIKGAENSILFKKKICEKLLFYYKIGDYILINRDTEHFFCSISLMDDSYFDILKRNNVLIEQIYMEV